MDMYTQKKRTILIGFAFLICLMFSYYENTIFFNMLNALSQNQFLFFLMIFINNVTVVSLVLLGMTFYVNLVVSDFFKREKYAYVVLQHPRTFAIIFAFVVLFLSILRGVNFLFGRIVVEALPSFLMLSTPIGIIEGYGIYITIEKTLSRKMSMKNLTCIYGIFLIAAVVEVTLIALLT